MSTKNAFVGNDAPFYQALLGRNVFSQTGSADISTITTQLIQLTEEVFALKDEVGTLRYENQNLKEYCNELERRIKSLEKQR